MAEAAVVRGGVFDLPGLAEVEDRVVALERQARSLHAQRLRAVLDLHRRHTAAGTALMTTVVWALHTDSGEHAARALLEDALLLDTLPGALTALTDGLLGVPHSRAVCELLGPLELSARQRVWELLLPRLRADLEQSRPRPPARLRELLHRLVRRVDADGVEARRSAARALAAVTVRHRDGGVADLFATGLSALDATAVDDRLDLLARLGDPTVELGRRKTDLLVDLLLGRRRYATADDESGTDMTAAGAGRRSAAGALVDGAPCGCLPGNAPCGAQVQILVPLGTVLEAVLAESAHSDDHASGRPAEVVGAGLLPEADLQAVLRSAPVLRAVWVDSDGLPVAVSERPVRAPRVPGMPRNSEDDPGCETADEALLAALHRLLERPPPALHPRHPDDHTPAGHSRALPPRRPDPHDDPDWWHSDAPPPPEPGWLDPDPADLLADLDLPDAYLFRGHLPDPDLPDPPLPQDPVAHDPAYWHALERELGPTPSPPASPQRGPQVRQHPHPAGTPGPYRPTADQRRLLHTRSPRCEWPGCGTRATRCDLDHDVPWPEGPTCTCNLGALCRHHHQTKQTGWTKQRTQTGTTTWTNPTGHTWTSADQHPRG